MMLLDDSGEAARCSAFETLIANMSHDMAKGNDQQRQTSSRTYCRITSLAVSAHVGSISPVRDQKPGP